MASCCIFCVPVHTSSLSTSIPALKKFIDLPRRSWFPWRKGIGWCSRGSGAFWPITGTLLAAVVDAVLPAGMVVDVVGADVGERLGVSAEGLPSRFDFSSTVGLGIRKSSPSWVSPPGGGGSAVSSLSSSGAANSSASSLNSSA